MVFSGQTPASEMSASNHLPIKTNKQTKTIIKTGNVKKNLTVGYQEKYFLERVKAKIPDTLLRFLCLQTNTRKTLIFSIININQSFSCEKHMIICNTVSFRQTSLGTLFMTILEDIINKYTYIHVCIFFSV